MTGPTPRPPGQALLYHFTHIDNMASILRSGWLAADSTAAASGLTIDVGDIAIKAGRRGRHVPIDPGGVVADYVPFYFAPRSPMMYRIACDHRDAVPGRYPGGDDPLVYLVTSVDRLPPDAEWVATDGNAAAAVTAFTRDAEDLAALVDWPLMEQRSWNDTEEDMDRMRRRMAELLVHHRFPITALHGYAVRSADREQDLRSVLQEVGHDGSYVGVRPDWYYGYLQREGGGR